MRAIGEGLAIAGVFFALSYCVSQVDKNDLERDRMRFERQQWEYSHPKVSK